MSALAWACAVSLLSVPVVFWARRMFLLRSYQRVLEAVGAELFRAREHGTSAECLEASRTLRKVSLLIEFTRRESLWRWTP
jgi:hypothetical protein